MEPYCDPTRKTNSKKKWKMTKKKTSKKNIVNDLKKIQSKIEDVLKKNQNQTKFNQQHSAAQET